MDKVLNLPFVNAWLKMIANFLDYKGRTSKSDFWWAVLGNIIVMAVLGFVFGLLGSFGSVLLSLVSLVLSVPGVMMSIRRLHDINKSGWWLLLSLTGIGGIVLLIWALKDGDEDDNQYGTNPKYLG